uniref:Uncharacterized protein n=1 Tax=Siphoviridae sp. ctxMM9 TaxID=2827973 RepID=A0A8S5T6U6_9CAUD|nr:MAG TPA: hypothetical protein [Siphoviridae sp. ctxMM9]
MPWNFSLFPSLYRKKLIRSPNSACPKFFMPIESIKNNTFY